MGLNGTSPRSGGRPSHATREPASNTDSVDGVPADSRHVWDAPAGEVHQLNRSWDGHPAGPVVRQPTGSQALSWGSTVRARDPAGARRTPPASPPRTADSVDGVPADSRHVWHAPAGGRGRGAPLARRRHSRIKRTWRRGRVGLSADRTRLGMRAYQLNRSWDGHPAGPVARQPTGSRALSWGSTVRARDPAGARRTPPASPPRTTVHMGMGPRQVHQSLRSVSMGSTEAARRAGMTLAMIAAPARAIAESAYVSGSKAVTP